MTDGAGEGLSIDVPTYYGGVKGAQPLPEFGEPHHAVRISPAEGIRLVLTSLDIPQERWAEVQIERRPGAWALFLLPLGQSGDASGFVYLLDDGRSFASVERPVNHPMRLKMVSSSEEVPELDRLR